MDAEIRFFHCGNGDTILIRGGEEWGLIDANLTARSGAEERLAAALRDNGVKRLRFVLVTHFDADHIRGLGRFLRKHFGPNGADRTKWEIEQIIMPFRPSRQLWRKLFCVRGHYEQFLGNYDDATKPFVELFDVFREVAEADHEIFQPYDPRTWLVSRSLSPASAPLGPWEMCFIGPSVEIEEAYLAGFDGIPEAEIRSWPRSLQKEVEKNETSRIIVLRHQISGKTVLLTGDATAPSIAEALLQWENARDDSKDGGFRMVKASHHGAWTERVSDNCHHKELYTVHSRAGHTDVVISCRDGDDHHPHDNMLRCAHRAGLAPVATGIALPIGNSGPQQQRGIGPPIGLPHRANAPAASDVIFRFSNDSFKIVGGNPIPARVGT